MITLLRSRLRELRSRPDEGFVLIYVLGIIAVVTILVGSTLTITANTIVPTVRSAYGQAATAAAQGGLQAFIAYADAHCSDANASVDLCTLPSGYSGYVTVALNDDPGTAYTSKYAWSAQKDPDGRYFRVRSTGVVSEGGITTSKTLVADVAGGASTDLFDYGVVTGFESQSSSTVLAQWPRRTIALDQAAIDAAGVPIKGGSITWSGASPGSAAGKVAVCNATFDAKGGRSNNPPHDAPTPYVDWTESGLKGNNYTNFQPCQTSWGTGTELLPPLNPADGAGGYYSADAMLLSNSYPGGTGPLFDQPVETGWRYQPTDAGLCGTNAGNNYRSFDLLCAGYPVEVGGSPSPKSTAGSPQWAAGPTIPTSSPTIPSDACVYAGPTRVLLDGDAAIVTSPQTTPGWITANAADRPSQCYTGAGATGMALQKISLTTPDSIGLIFATHDGTVPNTTPAIAHGSSGWPTTGQRAGDTASTSNSVFYLSDNPAPPAPATTYTVAAADSAYTPATGQNPSTQPDGDWTPGWTSYSTGSGCSTTTADTDLHLFNCDVPHGTAADAYSWVKTQVQAAIAANPDQYSTASQLQTLLTNLTSPGDSSDAGALPTNADNSSHRWRVSVTQGNAGSCHQASGVQGSATTTQIEAPTDDPLFTSTPGKSVATPSRDTSCYTATVTLQVGTCNVALVLGLCVNIGNYVWGDGTALLGGGKSIAQFAVTFTVTKATTSTSITPSVSSFPSMSDVTQYQIGSGGTFGTSGPGDLYVEGTANHTMALVASDDAVVTGPLTTSAIDSSTLEIIGQNDVRVYHPVGCTDTTPAAIAATDPGFCPNDITGLYTTLPPDGSLPYQQYVNLRPDLADLTVNGAVLALGNSPAHITCPEPPDGGGVCGGEISVDNYGRGAALGHLNIVGTIAMAHHAPVGLEWEIPDTSGQKGRSYSGYQLAERYQNLTKMISDTAATSGLLQTTSSTSSLWHIVSTSTASGDS